MSGIQYAIRNGAGVVQRGSVDDYNSSNFDLALARGDTVSLNLRPSAVQGYNRSGDDLELLLADGRKIVLHDFFDGDGGASQLYLNEDGRLLAVEIDEAGAIRFEEAAAWGKWSELDALTFPNDPVVEPYGVAEAADAAVEDALVAGAAEEEVSTQALGIGLAQLGIGGLGGLGTAGAAAIGGAAVLGGAALLGAGGGDGQSGIMTPTVDHADALYSIGGSDAQMIQISGTAEPGAVIEVRLGDEVIKTKADEDGRWRAAFSGGKFPADGSYEAVVTVTNPDGSVVVLDGPAVVIDTVAPDVDAGGNLGMGGHWLNAEAADGGVTLNGTGEPGAEITVEVEGKTRTTTVGADGAWSVHFAEGELPGGEYATKVTVTATDSFGNQTVRTETLAIDTVAPDLAFAVAEGDNVVNAAERADGVVISGTAEPGARLVVSYGAAVYETVAGVDGGWSVTFAPEDFPEGDYQATITAVATDQAGNSTTTTSVLRIDTAGVVTIEPGTDGGEPVVNAGNGADGVELTGTAEPGSQVTVEYDGESYEADVDADGNWTVTVPAENVDQGEYEVDVTVTATDGAGNTSTTSSTVVVDTETHATVTPGYAGSDHVIGAGEASSGVTFTGTAEPGATIDVTFEGSTHQTTADADGNWSVDFDPTEIPGGRYTGTLEVTATDVAGNSTTLTETVAVDTETAVTANTGAMGGDGTINAAEAAAGVLLTGTAEPGAAVSVTLGGVTRTTTATTSGTWAVTWPAGELPSGEVVAPVLVTATDQAGNTASTTGGVNIDTLVRNFTPAGGPDLADGVIAGPERAGGLTFTGTTEPGASVTVQFAGATRAATVGADGSWSVTFPEGTIPTGEYTTTLTTTTTDKAGNMSSSSETVLVDTVAGHLTLSAAPIEIDDVVNAAERADGVTVTGTATPGMVVTVGLGAATTTTVAAPDGRWSADFSAGDIPAGTWNAAVTASITDAYGNSRSVADSVRIDTEVRNFATDAPIAGDGVISGAEAASGVTLTGSVEPGSVVSVRLGLVTRAAHVAADGSWTVDFAPGEIPPGEHPTSITVTATDLAGNTAMLSETVDVDTLVSGFALTGQPGGDGYLNAGEAALGLTLTGTVEPGAQIAVTYNGTTTRTVVAGADGAWAVAFTGAEVGTGDFLADVQIAATDAVGNTDVIETSVHVDTEAPDPAYITAFTRAGDVIRDISVPVEDDVASVTGLAPDGSTPNVLYATSPSAFYPDETDIALGPVPDGTHLVINRADEAGNTSSTLLAMEDSGTDIVSLDNSGLDGVNLDAIDLRIAENSDLTISADLLERLSTNGNTLTVHGSEDDTLHIDTSDGSTFAATGETVTIGADTYNVYTLGDEGGTLIIDDEINIVT